jgi:hypothetical protein
MTGTGGANNRSSAIVHNDEFRLGDNGGWTSGRNGFAALNTDPGFIRFTFATPQAGVGGLINYGRSPNINLATPSIAIFDVNNVQLELENLTGLLATPARSGASCVRPTTLWLSNCATTSSCSTI